MPGNVRLIFLIAGQTNLFLVRPG